MATFHIRKQGTAWDWVLVSDQEQVLARSPGTFNTRGEADAAIAQVQREIGAADTRVDTTVPESRWRGIDGVTGEILPGPAPEPEETHDEGETGPPEVDGDDRPAA